MTGPRALGLATAWARTREHGRWERADGTSTTDSSGFTWMMILDLSGAAGNHYADTAGFIPLGNVFDVRGEMDNIC